MHHSFLFVPGDRPERFPKALAANAHAIVIDLEDAVQVENKEAARQAAHDWLAQGRPAVVRINGAGTRWHESDLRLADNAALQAIMLPKTENLETLGALRDVGISRVIALVESALGVWNLREIAAAPNVTRLAFGSIDFGLDAGIEEDGVGMLYARSRMVLASAIAGLPSPIDGVTASLGDEVALEGDIATARRLGFGGKLCIHPRQVQAVNVGFAPNQAQIDRAREIVRAADAAPASGAFSLHGQMIDSPVIERARRLLGVADV